MRPAVAAALALFLLVTAAGPHVHTGPHGREDCAVCVVRNADVARTATPDVAPVAFVAGDPPPSPGLPPVSGAPLGAIPGQSPPGA
jgi:hypothetical protein